jgi:hypothetical protein
MSTINLSSTQLRQAADLKDQIAALETQLAGLLGNEAPAQVQTPKRGRPRKLGRPAEPVKIGKRTMSAAHKAAIRAAQAKRWAKFHAAKGKPAKAEQKPVKKRKMSRAGRAAIIAAVKARWAKVRAGKN